MRTKITGVTFANEDGSSRRDIIARMSENDTICLERDPMNPFDSSAVKVCVVKDGRNLQIGYLPKGIAAQVSPRMRRREVFSVSIVACGIYMERPYCEIEIAGL